MFLGSILARKKNTQIPKKVTECNSKISEGCSIYYNFLIDFNKKSEKK